MTDQMTAYVVTAADVQDSFNRYWIAMNESYDFEDADHTGAFDNDCHHSSQSAFRRHRRKIETRRADLDSALRGSREEFFSVLDSSSYVNSGSWSDHRANS